MSDETPVGIDLGTTFSCVGIWRNNQVEIIANSEGQRTTPSYVSYKQNGEILIGQPAQRQLSLNPSNTIYDMKRLIGNKNALESIKRNGKYWTFKVNENSEVEVNLDNQKKCIKPEEVSAQILIKLKQSAENVVRKPIKNIVLTVPAYFDENQKKATTKAAELAGLNVVEMISEPSAAAYAYGFDQQKFSDTNLLVFDLGGGTLDVVIVKIKDGIFNVVGIGGNTQLGGRDFDNVLMDYFVDIIEEKYNKEIAENVKVMQKLLRECIDLKIMLSANEEANLYLGDLFPGIDEDIKIDQATFNKLCFPLFHRIEMIILGTLKVADMSADKIEEIILVGGSSRMPEIKELLLKIFPNKKLNFGLNPDEAIAYGATLRATQISKKGKTNIILNETNAKRLKNTSSTHTYNPVENNVYDAKVRATHMAKKEIPIKLNVSNAKQLQNTTKDGSIRLIYAVKNNNIDMVRLLLENGENPNAIGTNNQIALHLAASDRSDTLIVKLLLKHGADIEIQAIDGWTSLMKAVSNNNINIVRYLLEQGADPNRKSNSGKTALYNAASNLNDNILIVELLLKHGADIEIQDKDGWTSLMKAVSNNNINIVRYLLEQGADPNRKSNSGKTALYNAASNRNDNTLIVELLLKHGADIEIQDKDGWTSLMKAVSNNKINIVRYLLEQGADPNRKNNSGKTALYNAASNLNDNILIVELLLKHGADIEIQDKDGWTSLMKAVSNNKINIVRYLLEQGADPNRKNNFQQTALRYAASNRKDNTLIVELLLKHGADIEIQTIHGWTSLMEASFRNKINIIRYLLEHGADPNRQNKKGKTALHHAASSNNILIVELLLKHGADIDIRDRYGWTSLMRAVSFCNINIVRYLLEQGADPEKINTDGNTALQLVRSMYNTNKEMLDLFSKYVKK